MPEDGDLPPWMSDKSERKKRNARSRRQERKRADEVGGHVQAGSGSSWRRPEDVVGPDAVEQLKFTDADGFRVTAAELERILDNALRNGREARLVIEFSRFDVRLVGTIERT